MEKKGIENPAPSGQIVKQSVDVSGGKSPVVKPVQEVVQKLEKNYHFSLKPTLVLGGKPITGGAGKMVALGIVSTAISIYSMGYLHGYANGSGAGNATGGGDSGGGEEPEKIEAATFLNNPFY